MAVWREGFWRPGFWRAGFWSGMGGGGGVTALVPYVLNLDQSSAITTLALAGFVYTVGVAYSDEPVGSVIQQSPAAGVSAVVGSSVALVISRGLEVDRDSYWQAKRQRYSRVV